MKTIELTTRLRVPDETTSEQLAQLNLDAAVLVKSSAQLYLAGADGVRAHVELVTPLQDVIIYGDTL